MNGVSCKLRVALLLGVFKMKYIILILLLIPSISAETTFSEDSDSFLVFGSSTTDSGITGGIIGGTANGGTGREDCRYEWNCTNWSVCFYFEKQTRNCINIGTCPDKYKTPETERNCISKYEKTEDSGETITEEKNEGKRFIYLIVAMIIGLIIIYLKKTLHWSKNLR